MTILEICQALLGTTSLSLLARSGWLFFKAIEPGWQQKQAERINAGLPMRLNEVKAKAGLRALIWGVFFGLISIWGKAFTVAILRIYPI